MSYNFWDDPLDLKCIALDAEMERRAKAEAEEEQETIAKIDDYMNSNCEKCSFGKGSQQCENCYVGGY